MCNLKFLFGVTFFKLKRFIFFVAGKTFKFFEHYLNKLMGICLERALNFKLGCIYRTSGDNNIKLRCTFKIFDGILKKQGLQMLNNGVNLSLLGQFE